MITDKKIKGKGFRDIKMGQEKNKKLARPQKDGWVSAGPRGSQDQKKNETNVGTPYEGRSTRNQEKGTTNTDAKIEILSQVGEKNDSRKKERKTLPARGKSEKKRADFHSQRKQER